MRRIRGFTLIEIVLYIFLITILLSALIPFTWNVIHSGVKSSVQQDLNSQARSVSERIKYEIRNADAINSVNTTSLDLATATNQRTIIDLSAGKVRIRYGLAGIPVALNSNSTSVTSLTFSDRTSADFKTRSIYFTFTISDVVTSVRQEYTVPSITIQGSAVVRTPAPISLTPVLSPSITPLPPTNTPIPPSPTPTPPFWAYRKQITILDTKVAGSSNFPNFPVLITITDADLAARAQNDGDDIKFTTSDGLTKLDHEIESFDGTTGALVAWVQLPVLNATANTVIYMYYGNLSASNQQNVAGTWDASYKGVWHLKEASNTMRMDSTNNNNDLTDVNGNTARVTGRVGSGASFTGASGLGISDAAQTGLDITSSLTLESWFYLTAVGTTRNIMGKHGAEPQHGYQLRFNESSDRFTVGISTDGTNDLQLNSATTGLTTGIWYHGVGIYDGSNLRLYLNGFDEGIEFNGGTIYNNTAYFCLGGRGNDCETQTYMGILDEVRVSNTVRSANWIQTEYNNMSSPSTFYTIGAQQLL